MPAPPRISHFVQPNLIRVHTYRMRAVAAHIGGGAIIKFPPEIYLVYVVKFWRRDDKPVRAHPFASAA